ncbi:MAG: M1 family peptidase [Calditrichaeota bacterium]|nr:MAG: M1 family peptidase [Calditrichota bacterium]
MLRCFKRLCLAAACAALLTCGTAGKEAKQVKELTRDVHTHARPEEIAVRHLDLDVQVDFDARQIRGVASLELVHNGPADSVILDVRQMDIHKVTLDDDPRPVQFRLGKADPVMGQALVIPVREQTRTVHVTYATHPDAAGIQWLSPDQTAGKRRPFLYSQSQPILARSWVPCQDSPGIRITYRATVRVPSGMLALMSARNPQKRNPSGEYHFEMPQPVPPYLLALAVGDIDFQPLSQRSGVYAEPPVVQKAAWEFAETEKMIQAAEALYGPYRWERYDILVLPPSFPFGGMENPRLTFATPTVLAGDRSLTSLVAHELAHSWSGNLVTNATWNDFWLNEGFTTYFERRIMEALYGRSYSEMLAQLGYQDLKATIKQMGEKNPDTRLYVDLAGRDPDEGITNIPYEKGYFFLRMLEEHFGRERWDAFLHEYFDTFAFQSMTTARFIQYLNEKLLKGDAALARKLEIVNWVYGTGLPRNCPVPHSAEFQKVEKQIAAWENGVPAESLKVEGWTTHHWLHFLRHLPPSLSAARMAELDRAFHFTTSGNSEILCQWFQLAIEHGYQPAFPAMERYLTSIGRRKLVRPLYEKLAATPEGLEKAREIYRRARPLYHAITRNTIDRILNWSS